MKHESEGRGRNPRNTPTLGEGDMFNPTHWKTDRACGGTTVIKAYEGQPRFPVLYEDNLENITEIYANIADICDATPRNERRALSVML